MSDPYSALGASPPASQLPDALTAARDAANEKSWISGQSAMDRAKNPAQLQAQWLAHYPQGTAESPAPFVTPQSAQQVSDAVPRLPEYAKPGKYNTDLGTPEAEIQFQQWVKQNNIPFDPAAPVSDYDMRGFWKALQTGDPKAKEALNSNDGQMHFPDYWKTPYHESFSNESQWADPVKAPRWNNQDQLVTPDGKVVFDEKQKAAEKIQTKSEGNKQTLSQWLNAHGLPASLDQATSGEYPLGVAAIGKALKQMK